MVSSALKLFQTEEACKRLITVKLIAMGFYEWLNAYQKKHVFMIVTELITVNNCYVNPAILSEEKYMSNMTLYSTIAIYQRVIAGQCFESPFFLFYDLQPRSRSRIHMLFQIIFRFHRNQALNIPYRHYEHE